MPTVKDKYGFFPGSVWDIKRGSALREAIGDLHGEGTRRSEDAKYLPGLKYSSFNPDLAKRVIEYWSKKGNTIVDPFAGHSTRMLVAKLLNRNYIGFEVGPKAHSELMDSLEQRQMGLLEEKTKVDIRFEDGCIMSSLKSESADLIFTCPPYWNIEVYEEVANELSHCKDYDTFLSRIRWASSSCFRVLKPGKFMVWVVADFRKDGFKVFHRDCLDIFEQSGFHIWDIVINVLHSALAWAQIGKCEQHRYTSKVHEYVLVAKKEG